MMLKEVKKIKISMSELQRCIPVTMETVTIAKQFECKDVLPISSLDELKLFDSYIKNGTDFKADYVRTRLLCSEKVISLIPLKFDRWNSF